MKCNACRLILFTVLLLPLLWVACQKDTGLPNNKVVESALVETLQLDFSQSLPAELHGEWVYCGRVIDPQYFLNEDLPQELRDADFFVDITKAPSENVDKWSSVRLRTVYKTLFAHRAEHAEQIKKRAVVTEHSFAVPSYLTPLYLREGDKIVKVATDLKAGNKLSCYVYGKNFALEFRPDRIVIADTTPFRWIVLKRI